MNKSKAALRYRFRFPAGCAVLHESGDRSELQSVVMREIVNVDAVRASVRAEKNIADRSSRVAIADAATREAIRMTIEEVNGQRVNRDTPYLDLDMWNGKAYFMAENFFETVNGVSMEDAKSYASSGEIVTEEAEAQETQPPKTKAA